MESYACGGKVDKMNVSIQLSNHLIAEAIRQLLITGGYANVISGDTDRNGLDAHVLIVDVVTLTQGILARYPDAKVILLDTGIESEKLCAVLLSYKIHGVFSQNLEVRLLKKALAIVAKGQIWIDNGTVRSLLHENGAISRTGKITGVTRRERTIIENVCQGYGNKEIARRLSMSEHTVKTHLSILFRKFNVKSRSKLITLMMDKKASA